MLRIRLLFGLLTLIVLLWAVGAAALLLMRDSTKRFDKRLTSDYHIIRTAHTFRQSTSTINSRYLPTLAGPAPEKTPDNSTFLSAEQEL